MYNAVDAVRADLEAAWVAVVEHPLQGNKCLSLADGELIALDPARFESQQEQATALIHEEGHFTAGAFHVPFSPYQVKAQAEYRADKAAALKRVPPGELAREIRRGLSIWEIADRFNVLPSFIWRAYTIYRDNMGLNLAEL